MVTDVVSALFSGGEMYIINPNPEMFFHRHGNFMPHVQGEKPGEKLLLLFFFFYISYYSCFNSTDYCAADEPCHIKVNVPKMQIYSKVVAAVTRVMLEQTFVTILSTSKGQLKLHQIAAAATNAALTAAAHEFMAQQFLDMKMNEIQAKHAAQWIVNVAQCIMKGESKLIVTAALNTAGNYVLQTVTGLPDICYAHDVKVAYSGLWGSNRGLVSSVVITDGVNLSLDSGLYVMKSDSWYIKGNEIMHRTEHGVGGHFFAGKAASISLNFTSGRETMLPVTYTEVPLYNTSPFLLF